MMDGYREFFAASTGAAAAFIGLLFVALSFIDGAKIDGELRAWRRIIASSSFAQLINIFFVSLAGLTPDPHNVAFVGCVMAVAGLAVSIRLFPLMADKSRSRPSISGLIAVAAYCLELLSGLLLLHNPNNQALLSYFALALIILFAGALARAWEITGLKHRS